MLLDHWFACLASSAGTVPAMRGAEEQLAEAVYSQHSPRFHESQERDEREKHEWQKGGCMAWAKQTEPSLFLLDPAVDADLSDVTPRRTW
jgi:hypothetical protein